MDMHTKVWTKLKQYVWHFIGVLLLILGLLISRLNWQGYVNCVDIILIGPIYYVNEVFSENLPFIFFPIWMIKNKTKDDCK